MIFRRLSTIAAIVILLAAGYLAGSMHLLQAQHTYADDDCQTFSQTGKTVCGRFLQYWQQNGGLAQQGLPLSDAFNEKSDVNGQTYKVQYFERAVFELHPENQPPYDVLLSLLGHEKFLAKYPNGDPTHPSTPTPPANPAGWPRTAQGQGFTLTVYEVRDNVPGDQYFKPKAGYRWFAIDAAITNTSSALLDYNPYFATLRTTDGREWDQPIGGLEPDLKSGTQQPGETVRGWITFEVGNGVVPASFIYDPTFGDGPAIITLP